MTRRRETQSAEDTREDERPLPLPPTLSVARWLTKRRHYSKGREAGGHRSSFVAEDIGQMGLFRGQAGYLGQSSSSHPGKSLGSRPPTRRTLPLARSITIMSEYSLRLCRVCRLRVKNLMRERGNCEIAAIVGRVTGPMIVIGESRLLIR